MPTEAQSRLTELLEYLSEHLDPVRQREVEARHRKALCWEPLDRLPVVISYPVDPGARFKPWPHREIFEDPSKMLFNELTLAFECRIEGQPDVGSDLPCTIRANFGTVIIASMFGAEIHQTEDNPPWVSPETHKRMSPRAISDTDPADFTRGLCPQVIERYQFYRETLAAYPRLASILRMVLPDMQGPFDTLELLLGSNVFTALHDTPGEVEQALRTLALAQVNFARYMASLTNDGPPGFAHQQAAMLRGTIMVRNDTAILISPSTYTKLIAPHDAFVLKELGGGGIHSCGVVQRHTSRFMQVPGMQCFDFGQPELNDIDQIYAEARSRGIALTRVCVSESELVNGTILERFPTGVTLRHRANSAADARRIIAQYSAVAAERAAAHDCSAGQ